jgi:hypothetical protein
MTTYPLPLTSTRTSERYGLSSDPATFVEVSLSVDLICVDIHATPEARTFWKWPLAISIVGASPPI